MSATVQKMQKENEQLKYKLKQADQKLTENQKLKEKLKAKVESVASVDVSKLESG